MISKVARVAVLCLMTSLFAIGCGWEQIPPSSVGIKFNGKTGVSNQLVKPQVVFVGVFDQLIIYPTSVKNASYLRDPNEGEKKGDDALRASTKEGAILPVDMTIAYHVAPENTLLAFKTFGTSELSEVQKNYLRWAGMYALSVVSGGKSIFDIISKDRGQLGPSIKAVLSPILSEWGLTVDDVYIGEVYPPEDVKSKVDESMGVQNEYERAKIESQKAITDAKTIITNAERTAETNRLLSLQGKKAIALKRLELRRAAIRRWNGRTPLVGDGYIPFTRLKPE